ncbi:uroporphyrinogen-III synthase [Ceratocystis pirilliformis]|uniref:Uroporphyrinogen-III synthase n=1 Tax=Ceratocystis pirilliformis TaxID=259994 RepID=A0ABR3ZI48_9PEZI
MEPLSQASLERRRIPVLLLKTPSAPTDAYRDLFNSSQSQAQSGHRSDSLGPAVVSSNCSFEPRFVPVLDHHFDEVGIQQLANILSDGGVGPHESCKYGGLVFTSQRAVEAFAHVLVEGRKKHGNSWPKELSEVPFYSVGPATTRSLAAAAQPGPTFQIFGEETGNGDALSKYILEHYRAWYPEREALPGLLFCVGEQRRDIIPKTLMDPELPASRRIMVDELVVYGTDQMTSFESDLENLLQEYAAQTPPAETLWAVVFSPIGCDGLLRKIGALGPTGRAVLGQGDPRVLVATIGPTTRAHLVDSFGYEPHVCAAKPSPTGVLNGIATYMAQHAPCP